MRSRATPASATTVAKSAHRLCTSIPPLAAIVLSASCQQAKTPVDGGGRLSVGAVYEVLNPRRKQAHKCYQDALARAPQLEGFVVVIFVVNRDGTISEPSYERAALPDSGARSCILAAYRGAVFPPPEGGTMKLSVATMFTPNEEDKTGIAIGDQPAEHAADDINRAAALAATDQAGQEARQCFAKTGELRQLSVAVRLSSAGRAEEAHIEGKPQWITPAAEQCVKDAYLKATVPPFAGTPVTVHRKLKLE